MSSNTVSKKKIKLQYAFTIILLILNVVLAIVFFGTDHKENGLDKRLAYRLVNGQYASCYGIYNTNRNLEGTDFLKGPEFKPFKEFMSYYDNYIKFVIYDEYDDYFNTDTHMEQKDEYIEAMVGIRDSSQYSENYPHYDYLLEYANENR